MQTLLKITILITISALITTCTKEAATSTSSPYPVFPKIGKTYIVGIAKHTPRNENTPISIFNMTILEHGGGSWYRVSFKKGDIPPKTIETWFNLDSATFISEGQDRPAMEVFPIF